MTSWAALRIMLGNILGPRIGDEDDEEEEERGGKKCPRAALFYGLT